MNSSNWWDWLTTPIIIRNTPTDSRKLQLVLRFTLMLVVVVLAIALLKIVGIIEESYFFADFNPATTFRYLVFLAIVYFLGKRGYANLAGFGLIVGGSVLTILNAALEENVGTLSNLILYVVISSILFSKRLAIGLVLFQVAASLALTVFYPNIDLSAVTRSMAFVIVGSTVISLISHYRLVLDEQTRRKLADSEALYRSLFEASVNATLLHDGTTILMCSDSAAHLFGFRHASEFIGQKFAQYIHPEEQELVKQRAQQRIQGKGAPPPRYEIRIIGADGVARWLDTHSTRIFLQGQPQTLVQIVDVTERKNHEIELGQHNEYLKALQAITVTLMNQWEVDDLLHHILDHALELFGTQEGYIYLYVPEEDMLELQKGSGAFQQNIGFRTTKGKGLGGQVWEQGDVVIVYDYRNWEHRLDSIILGNTVSIGLPMQSNTRFIGVLGLIFDEKVFDSTQLDFLRSYTQVSAIAIENAQLYKALIQSEAYNKAILDIQPDLILRQNRQGVYLDMRYEQGQQWNFPPERYLGKTPYDILPLDLALSAMAVIKKTLQTGSQQTFEFTSTETGEQRYYESRFVKLNREEVLVIVRDMTDHRRAVDHEIALQVERERVQMMQNFISDASHDLKTPLANLKSRVFLLRKYIFDEKPLRQVQVLDYEIDRLEKLINDMLTMTQLDSQSEHDFKSVHINTLIHDLIPNFSQKRGVEIKFIAATPLPTIQAIPLEMNRLLQNLIGNALQYTERGHVQICTKAVSNGIVIEVQDTGIGIDAEEQARIFERFYRTDKARNTNNGGTGLGLAIVKKIVDLHHGKVEVASEFGKGSTFRVWLPHKIFP